jgi:hypothetical protein
MQLLANHGNIIVGSAGCCMTSLPLDVRHVMKSKEKKLVAGTTLNVNAHNVIVGLQSRDTIKFMHCHGMRDTSFLCKINMPYAISPNL